MTPTLVIGNKNYSSWSMRPWIAMRNAGIVFDELLIPLYEPGSAERARGFTPTGKVPVLVDGDVRVWESLAILEYLAEKHPDAGLWPAAPEARAHARAISAEMHAGFGALRRNCPMNLWRPPQQLALSPEVQTDALRIDRMWTECRARFGQSGPFLFGDFSAADAMYTPVVARFATYQIEVSQVSRDYMAATVALPAWREWRASALREPWVMRGNEPDWPRVPRLEAVTQ